MEYQLIKACLSSRVDFSLISEYLDIAKYSKEMKYVLGFIRDYYARDSSVGHVQTDLLKALIAESVPNEKHVERFAEIVDRSAATETSGANVTAIILLAKSHEARVTLATALANGDPQDKIDKLLEEYRRVSQASSLGDLEDSGEIELIDSINIGELTNNRLSRGNLLALYPKSLSEYTDGGVEGGDQIVLFGLSEIGKTAYSITLASGFAMQGQPGLYLINEDKTSRIAQRFVHCMASMDKFACMNDPDEAQRRANDRGLQNVRVIGLTPGSLGQIESLVERYSPKWLVLDQLRNIITPTKGNRVVQLEEAATGMRNILKKYNVVGVSVTQAGDSARNKMFLDMGDVDFSNVGIPSQADLMIGIGASDPDSNERGISLCKNKLSGNHAKYVTRLVPQLSQVRDV